MKTILRISLILCLFSTIWAGTAYEDFLKAWNAKDYPKSLQYIEKAYAEKPSENYIIYWYGIALFQNAKYAEAGKIFLKAPPDYLPLTVTYYLAQCALKTGKQAEGLTYLKKGITLPDDKANLKQYFFSGLMENLILSKDTKGLEETIPAYLAYMKDNPALNYTYPLYLLVKYYQSLAIDAGTNGNPAEGDKLIAKSAGYAVMGLGTYEAYYDPLAYAQAYCAAKNYTKAVSLYREYPPAQMTVKDIWYYAESLKQLGKSPEAVQVITKGLKQYQDSPAADYWKKHVYYSFVRLCSELKDIDSYEMVEKDILGYFKNNPDKDFDWLKFTAANMYVSVGFDRFGTTLSKTCFAKVRKYYDMGLGTYQNLIRISDINILSDAQKYWDQNYAQKKSSAYRLNMLFWFWGASDGQWMSLAGTNLTVKKTLDKSVTNDLNKSFAVFRMVYFYFSDGQILPEMDIKFIDATATMFTQTTYLSPISGKDGKPVEDFPINYIAEEQIPGFPGQMIYEYRNQYDVFCSVFPFEVTSGIASYGGQNIVPYIKQTKTRGGMRISDISLAQPWTIIHEFFHNVEATYRAALKGEYAFTAHMFRDIFMAYWPSWYHGEGELTYYKMVFDKYVLPTGCDKMHYKLDTDMTSSAQIGKYWKYYQAAPFADIKAAYKFKNAGMDFYYKGDKKPAFAEFIKSYGKFPYSGDVNNMLGLIYFQNNDFSNAYPYYLQAMEVDETNEYRLTMAGLLADKLGDYAAACADYQAAYDQYSGSPNCLYQAGRIYYTAKDFTNSEKCLLALVTVHPDSELAKHAVHLLANIYVYYHIDYPKAKVFLDKYYPSLKDKEVLRYVAVNYAIALGETGDKKAALKYLEKAKQYGAAQKTVDYYINKYSK